MSLARLSELKQWRLWKLDLMPSAFLSEFHKR